MVYTRYGEVFKKLRIQKGFSLSYFSILGIHKSSIARFEQGKSMLSVDKLDKLLQHMNVSFAEYELLLNRFVPEYQEDFLCSLEKAEFCSDNKKLHALYQEVAESENVLLKLAVKSKINVLNEREQEKILLYLKKVKYWGYFELCLAYAILEYLNTPNLKDLLENFCEKNKHYYDVRKYKIKMYQITYRAIIILSSRNEQKLASEILSHRHGSDENCFEFYLSSYEKLAKGFYIYCFESKSEGGYILEEVYSIFENLGNKNMRTFCENRIKYFISKIKK